MKEKTTIDYPISRLLQDLWRWLDQSQRSFVLASAVRALSDTLWLYPAFALSQVVGFLSTYQAGQSLQPLLVIAILWAATIVIRNATREGTRFIAYTISEKTALNAQFQAFRHLFSLDLAWHEQSNAGNKIKRLQRGSDGINEVLRMWTDQIIETVVQIVGIIIILATLDTAVSVAMIVFALTFLPLTIMLTRHAAAATKTVHIAEEDLSGLAFEAVNNVRSAKVLGMSAALVRLAQQAINRLFSRIQERIRRFRIRDLILQGYQHFFFWGIILFASWQVLHGNAAVGLLVLVYDYFRRVNKSVNDIGDNTQKLLVSMYAIGRLSQILDERVEIDTKDGKTTMPQGWTQIELRDVGFAYGKKRVLHGITLTIQRGEKIGIVGISGAGKSTLFKLLMKEYEDYAGEIVIGKTPLRSIRRDLYTKQTAVVLQDTEVFNFSLRDNIALANWKQRANEKMLTEAANIAHVTDFMNRLPDGYDTYIGEKGIRLSGGEKQRVGIARAVFKQPEILFMDEATSHLDSESEAKIQDSLQQFFKSVTAVVIAHRLSTIKQMDTIYVLEEGSIVESGSFKELLDKKGRFAQMWKRQQF